MREGFIKLWHYLLWHRLEYVTTDYFPCFYEGRFVGLECKSLFWCERCQRIYE